MGSKKKKNITLLPYLLIAPLLLWLIVTVFIPVVNVFIESLKDTTYVGSAGDFIGVKNYISVLQDGNYWKAWLKSLQWLIGCIVIQTVLGFGVALLLNGHGRIRQIARTSLYYSLFIGLLFHHLKRQIRLHSRTCGR